MGYKKMNPWREGLFISLLIALFNFGISNVPVPWVILLSIGIGPSILEMLNVINGHEN